MTGSGHETTSPQAADSSFGSGTAGATVKPCPLAKTHFVTFEFKDALGNDVAGDCFLEKPDGSVEAITHDGIFHREKIVLGEYQVHFPRFLRATWSKMSVDIGDDGAMSTVDLSVTHRAFKTGSKATFAVQYERAPSGNAAVVEKEVDLTHDDAKPLAEQTTKLTWDGTTLPELDPGDVISLIFTVTSGAQRVVSTPLVVSRLAPPSTAPEPTPDPTFINFAFKDALGSPATGKVVLEQPGGTLEDVELDEGVLYRENVPSGKYTVHFPKFTSLVFAKEIVDVDETGALPSVDATLGHQFFPADTEVEFSLGFENAPRTATPVITGKQKLTAAADRLSEQHTTLSLKLDGAVEVPPGESIALVLEVSAAGQRRTAPLYINRLAPKPAETTTSE